jgi:hypothetical protein
MVDQPDQPALGPDGQLLDATKMVWYNDPDDAQPIQPALPAPSGSTGMCISDSGLGLQY